MVVVKREKSKNKNNKQTKNNSRFFYLLIIFIGSLSILFGFVRILNAIKSPFKIDSIAEQQTEQVIDTQTEELAKLKKKDTDHDGLSDYDEQYIYGTSAYLADSDSDGYDDKQEIETGHNPNCPAGQKCLLTADSASSSTANSFIPKENPVNLNADQLRQMLIDNGVDQNALSQIDDNTLLQMYHKSLTEVQAEQGQNGSGKANNTSNVPKQEIDWEQLKKLSPDQVRELLIQSGIDKQKIDKMSDEELMKIYRETLAEQEKNNQN